MINRRKLIIGAVGGTLIGLGGMALTRNGASIRFIGRRNTIIALLDTSTERALIVLGERDDDLLDFVPGLKTVGNTRIDLVIAGHHILSTSAAREHFQLVSTSTISVQGSASLPPIRGDVTAVTSSSTIKLGKNTEIKISVAGIQDDQPDFLVDIATRETRLVLLSGGSTLRMNDIASPDLLALPGSADQLTRSNITPQILVCNTRSEAIKVPQMEVFPLDPSIIRLNDGSLSVRDDQLSS